ncbi:glutathione S-transferase family protein [Maritalea porphyrae]|uniref:glutathione S-transferase family protein n=1 Tax=Maritalea porphyrae TaxID=880732 RepID=UPI0022AF9674|nr:glutathione S-transferase family protein [Maritalea porphyrae]MCZ4271512.1 glutathione S-transferase family protein [Maritalea porphyrae]
MPNYKLISFPLCPYVQRALIVLAEKDVPFERIDIDLANKPDWFLKLSPLGKVPVLQADDNVLFESQVIAEYLDEVTPGSLHPTDPLQKAKHRAWIEFASQTLATLWGLYTAETQEVFETKRKELLEKFARVDEQIEGRFFAGDNFHLVDGVWGTVFRYIQTFETLGDFDFYQGSEKLRAWHNAVLARQSVIDAAPSNYNDQLLAFVKKRDGYLATLVKTEIAA